ncbi:DICT sensory domain-containing protein [Haloarchaeobius sp. DFWS5]|uniref:DICT sensory domain-containing protein n=1 Tax=Haloarchaeobius sp. DFWS5 TaxID=3446114 RepID=UPI003EB8BC37
MALLDLMGDLEGERRTLTVVNRTEVDLVQEMLEDLFTDQPVALDEVHIPDELDTDRIVVGAGIGAATTTAVDDETTPTVDDKSTPTVDSGSEPASTHSSSLESVADTILFVNSDTYISGARALDQVETPEALLSLSDIVFSVVGYPDTRKQKFLLIELSRFIEARAWQEGVGELHAGFQYLSRIEDERGTEKVYEALGETDVAVNLYGVPDWRPSPASSIAIHGTEDDEELRRSWFVVYQHPTDESLDAALVCYATGQNEWKGFWTFDADRVADVAGYIETAFQSEDGSAGKDAS